MKNCTEHKQQNLCRLYIDANCAFGLFKEENWRIGVEISANDADYAKVCQSYLPTKPTDINDTARLNIFNINPVYLAPKMGEFPEMYDAMPEAGEKLFNEVRLWNRKVPTQDISYLISI